ncbi:transcriptional regulator [Salmonella enterica subsp. enterica serovar Choleraesuis]|nr:transcriptional regulator [Salmonella enterica subsp. enterica serovar Choleraesuis]
MTDLDNLQQSATRAAQLLKSMSNSSRLLILCTLIESPGTTAGELARLTGLSPSAASQHLAIMKDDQLIEFKRDAQKIHYFIKDESVFKIVKALKEIFCPQEKA